MQFAYHADLKLKNKKNKIRFSRYFDNFIRSPNKTLVLLIEHPLWTELRLISVISLSLKTFYKQISPRNSCG